MLPSNQLAIGIQSKNVRGRGAETPVGSVRSKTHYEPGFRGGRSSPNTRNFCNFFFANIFLAPKFVIVYCGQFSKNFQHEIDPFAKNRIHQNFFFISFRELRIFWDNIFFAILGDLFWSIF